MKRHTKIYYDYFGYDEGDFISSEISGKPAVDIHHITARGMGGSKALDIIENLIALTREEHEQYGDKVDYKVFLHMVHKRFMKDQTPYVKWKFEGIKA